MAVHHGLRLRVYADKFVVEPTSSGNDSTVLVISRDSGSISCVAAAPIASSAPEAILDASILLGMIRLVSGDYLIVATAADLVGTLDLPSFSDSSSSSTSAHSIYKITKTRVLPFARTPNAGGQLTPAQVSDEKRYLQLLEKQLARPSMYFSPTLDLTNSLQRRAADSTPVSADFPLWKRADDSYFWNRHLAQKFIEASTANTGVDTFIVPVIYGFVAAQKSSANGGQPFTYALVTRRCRKRAGTRYFTRGVDAQGNASNFVETEQIVALDGGKEVFAHVQVRGSVPMYWAQVINSKYTPELVVKPRDPLSLEAFGLHMHSLYNRYGPEQAKSLSPKQSQSGNGDAPKPAGESSTTAVIAVNLVNKTKYEGKVADAFAHSVRQHNDDRLRYTHFDFHKECSKMRWDRVSLLIDELKDDLDAQAYFHYAAAGGIQSVQTSVVRTNCMDCLDRTNVVQGVVARLFLARFLRSKGVFAPTANVADYESLEKQFRVIWADNGDAVSTQYAGTGALKNDYTRTGKRTKWGAVQDFTKSATRYFQQQFFDGTKQDGLDLFLGNFAIDPSVAPSAIFSPFAAASAGKVAGVSLPMTLEAAMISLVFIVSAILVILTPFTFSLLSWEGSVALLTWILMAWVSQWYICTQLAGDVLNWPKLVRYEYQPYVKRYKGTLTPKGYLDQFTKKKQKVSADRKQQ
ncbi:hypothetical protein GQ42DRAFT_164730 [Ramicandelaber brevisporus]|nr:hypothetical protein GQ42DRAFT_164730 [Ramicandelaber brevisporus]